MFYIRHYNVYPYNGRLKTILETEFGIMVKDYVDVLTGDPKGMGFDISEFNPRFEEIEQVLPPETTSEQLKKQFEYYEKTGNVITDSVTIIHEAHFSKKELNDAKWISVRNTVSKIIPENGETVDSFQCYMKQSKSGHALGRHKTQAESYIIKAPIKWGRNAFVSAYSHEERLFCNDTIYSLLLSRGIRGIRTIPVLRKSTGLPMDGIHQIEAIYTVPDGGILGISEMTDFLCKQCGMTMLCYKNGRSRYGILEGVLDETVDIWQTKPMFLGPGQADPHSAQRELIISQRLYRFITENKLDRGFIFTPLEIITK